MPGFYMQNIKGMIQLDEEGVPTLKAPWEGDKTEVPLFDAARDTGTYVPGILSQSPKTVNGMYVQGCSEWRTPNEIVAVLGAAIGRQVHFQEMEPGAFKKTLPGAVAEEMTENMVLVRDYSYFGRESRQNQGKTDEILNGATKSSWREFVKASGPWKWSGGESALYKHL